MGSWFDRAEAATRPLPFARTVFQKGRIYDVLSPYVRQTPVPLDLGLFATAAAQLVPSHVAHPARNVRALGGEITTPASLGRKEESGGQGRVPGGRLGTRGRWYLRGPSTSLVE